MHSNFLRRIPWTLGIGSATTALSAHCAWLYSLDSLDERLAQQLVQSRNADPCINHAAEAIGEMLLETDVVIVSGPGAHLAAREAILGFKDGIACRKIITEKHDSLHELVESLRTPPSSGVWPSAAIAAAIAQYMAAPPLDYLYERLVRSDEALLCLSQRHVVDDESTRKCAAEIAKLGHGRVCITCDESLYAAEYVESLVAAADSNLRITHYKLSLPRGNDALARARCLVHFGGGQDEELSRAGDGSVDRKGGDGADLSEELAKWLVDHAGAHVTDLRAVAGAVAGEMAGAVLRSASVDAAAHAADAAATDAAATDAAATDAAATDGDRAAATKACDVASMPSSEESSAEETAALDYARRAALESEDDDVDKDGETTTSHTEVEGSSLTTPASAVHSSRSERGMLDAAVARCVEERRAALTACFQLDRVNEGESSAGESSGIGKASTAEDGGSAAKSLAHPVGVWAWAMMDELSGDITSVTVGVPPVSEPSGPADWQMPLREVLQRAGAGGLDRAVEEVDCLLAAGIASLDFVPLQLSEGGSEDGGGGDGGGDGDGGTDTDGGSRRWETMVVVSPLAIAAYNQLSSEPHAIAVIGGRQRAVYATEDRTFLVEDVREMDVDCAEYMRWEAAWADEMLLIFERKETEPEKVAEKEAEGAMLVLRREERRRRLGLRCKQLLKRAEDLELTQLLPVQHLCHTLVEEGWA